MADSEEAKASGVSPEETEEGSAPYLPASFFSRLVHQPKCITDGVCNNCGRCEH